MDTEREETEGRRGRGRREEGVREAFLEKTDSTTTLHICICNISFVLFGLVVKDSAFEVSLRAKVGARARCGRKQTGRKRRKKEIKEGGGGSL